MTKKQRKELLSAVEERRKQTYALLDNCPLCKKYSDGGSCSKCPAKTPFLDGKSYCVAFCQARNVLWSVLNEMVHTLT